MRFPMLAIAAALLWAPMPALAQAPAEGQGAANAPSRYTFNRTDDGFLRLDNTSGQIAYCSPHSVGWACQAVPEDRAALEKEIARLQDEVAALRKEVAELRAPPPSPRPPADIPPRSDDSKQLREDIERARTAIENAWRRLVEMIVTLQKDMMRKG